MELIGVKLKSNKEREPERKEARGADQTDSQRGTRETMMVALWIAIAAIIAFLKVLASNGRTKSERARPKDEQEICFVSLCKFQD